MGGEVLNAAAIFTALTGALAWVAKQYIDSLKAENAICRTRESALQKVIDDRLRRRRRGRAVAGGLGGRVNRVVNPVKLPFRWVIH
jgi:hypothetical protein